VEGLLALAAKEATSSEIPCARKEDRTDSMQKDEGLEPEAVEPCLCPVITGLDGPGTQSENLPEGEAGVETTDVEATTGRPGGLDNGRI